MDIFTVLKEHEKHAVKIDELTISNDYEGLKLYLDQFTDITFPYDEPESSCMLYYLGTGYGTLATHYQKDDLTSKDATEYRKRSFSYLRKAIELFEIHGNNLILLLRAYTNYANELDSCGRVIEAIRIYRKALALAPKFSMARGNYGRALQFYANKVNDSGHYKELHHFAYQSMAKALKNPDGSLYKDAIIYFDKKLKEYETLQDKTILSKPIIFKKYALGKSDERDYRLWCLEHHLFLNPLNDLIELESAFAHDPLTITTYTEDSTKDEETSNETLTPPKWFAMLNQLKEEYIYARYLCYEGTQKQNIPHYADKDVKLTLSSYDYVNYSIRLEQLKASYRSLFSIFDQVAFMINEFWQLGFSEREADAHHIFAKCDKYPNENVALKALYWSYLDFYEKFGISDNAVEKDLKILRNAFEHKFVKVHEYPCTNKMEIAADRFYHISEENLVKCTLRLLELSREFIMELVYAIGIEESKKTHDKSNVLKLDLADYDDNWKI